MSDKLPCPYGDRCHKTFHSHPNKPLSAEELEAARQSGERGNVIVGYSPLPNVMVSRLVSEIDRLRAENDALRKQLYGVWTGRLGKDSR